MQKRVFQRFVYFLVALFCSSGRRTLTAALPPGQDWSAFYRIFSRDLWSLDGLFDQVIRHAAPYLGPKPFIPVALDDTHVKKTGKLRGLVQYLYTGMSGRYKPQLAPGLRWIHAALLVFVPGEGPMALSIGFHLAQPLKRPKRASPEVLAMHRKEAPHHTASAKGVLEAGRVRVALDRAGLTDRTMLLVVDGGYMNRTFLAGIPERTQVLGRVRKDLHLVHPPEPGSRKRFYGDRAPTPDELRVDKGVPWQETRCFFGGASREVRFKELGPLRWPKATRHALVRLIVVAPTSYWLPGRNRKGYNLPAYLLTTDLETAACILIQAYFERWQIEVLHRDLKSDLGSLHPQVWNRTSVHRVIPAMAALWAFLRIAALAAFGPGRIPAVYGELANYRGKRGPSRPSPRDLLNRLRADATEAWGGPVWRTG